MDRDLYSGVGLWPMLGPGGLYPILQHPILARMLPVSASPIEPLAVDVWDDVAGGAVPLEARSLPPPPSLPPPYSPGGRLGM